MKDFSKEVFLFWYTISMKVAKRTSIAELSAMAEKMYGSNASKDVLDPAIRNQIITLVHEVVHD